MRNLIALGVLLMAPTFAVGQSITPIFDEDFSVRGGGTVNMCYDMPVGVLENATIIITQKGKMTYTGPPANEPDHCQTDWWYHPQSGYTPHVSDTSIQPDGVWTEMLPFEHDLPNPPPLEPFSECFFTELDFDGKTPVGSATIEYFQFTYDPATGDVTTGFAPGNTRSEQNETVIKAVQQKFCYAEKLHL